MTVTVTVRNVPDEVRDELAARAVRSGRSLEEYLLSQLVALAARPDRDAVVEQARARVRASRSAAGADDVLTARDADQR